MELKDKFKFYCRHDVVPVYTDERSEANYKITWEDNLKGTLYPASIVQENVRDGTWVIVDERTISTVDNTQSSEISLEEIKQFTKETDFKFTIEEGGFYLVNTDSYVSYVAQTVDELRQVMYALRILEKARERG